MNERVWKFPILTSPDTHANGHKGRNPIATHDADYPVAAGEVLMREIELAMDAVASIERARRAKLRPDRPPGNRQICASPSAV